MQNIGYLQNVLAASAAMIQRAHARIPGFDAPVPFQYELRTLRANQGQLERMLQTANGQPLQGVGNLGFPVLIVGGAILGMSAIGGYIYKHFTDAKRLDAQTSIYNDIRREGGDSERAASIVFGGGTDWASIMNKVIIITVIGAGIYLFVKLKK